MPTYKHEEFIERAIRSLLSQTLTDWELIVFDDGSPDGTRERVRDHLTDPRIRYTRSEKNIGLGAALNATTALAQGRYIAYLPSDDVYFASHLERLAGFLEENPDVHLAYGGVQIGMGAYEEPGALGSATLRGDAVVGREAEALDERGPVSWTTTCKSGNILALVQVMHRRGHEVAVPWTPRHERVSDDLEASHWRALLSLGHRFAYAGTVTCQWVQHPLQRHKIIGGIPDGRGFIVGGLAMYRAHYEIPAGEYLDWRPVRGYAVDERRRWEPVARRYPAAARRDTPPDRLRILLVGDLGFNPERVLVLAAEGDELAGLWTPRPEVWMGTGPFPFGGIRDIPFDGAWRSAVRDFAPDVICAGLGWQSLEAAATVLDAGFEAPFVLHFKESPNAALEHGLWPVLARLMRAATGRIFINDECRRWFEEALGAEVSANSLIMDGDLPTAHWFDDTFQTRLSARTGEIHTACSGRWKGPHTWEEFAEAGIHLHIYGDMFHQVSGGVVTRRAGSGYVHLHPTVQPEDWVRELSQYDAGWLHVLQSGHSGDLRSMTWSDLNLPARLGTYASAGLPWIHYDNAGAGSATAVERLAARLGVGVPFRTLPELAARLADTDRMRRLSENMRAHREEFTFEWHVPRLLRYFREMTTAHRRAGR